MVGTEAYNNYHISRWFVYLSTLLMVCSLMSAGFFETSVYVMIIKIIFIIETIIIIIQIIIIQIIIQIIIIQIIIMIY